MKICGDAGGTNIRLSYADNGHRVIGMRKYQVSQFPGGETGILMAINEFLRETKDIVNLKNVDTLIISVAGPIKDNYVQFRNNDWFFSVNHIYDNFKATLSSDLKVKIINDFEALAYGLASIECGDTVDVYSREGYGDTKIVCGPGSGLGLSALKQKGHGIGSLIVIPSEGGHQSFPVETSTEREIREYIMEDWVSYEHILSGQGLQILFSFFCQKTKAPNIVEQTPEQIVKLHSAGNVAARRTLEAFSYALGTFCGNMVLALGATQGVYLWGGILNSFPLELLRNNMMRRFHQRGRAAGYVSNVPVYRITCDELPLRGCSIFFEQECT